MKKETRWERCRIECPEQKGEGVVLIHWEKKDGKEVVCGMQCSNPYLKDLGGGDCEWSCWKKLAGETTETENR